MLECIGAIKNDKKDGTETAYQDSVTAPIGCEHDDDAVGQEDDNDDEEPEPPPAPKEQEVVLREVSSAVGKVRNHTIYIEL